MTKKGQGPGIPGPARKLTHEQILDVALEILADEGMAGLSQRQLAARLGVSHMALYRYFESKDDLLDAVVSHALPDPALGSSATSPWYEQIRGLLLQIHDVYAVTPGIAVLMSRRSGSGERVDATRERLMGLMILGGLPPAQAIRGLGVINRYLAGCAVLEASPRRASDADEIARLASLPADRFPVMTSIADHYLEHDSAEVAAFGVDLLVDCLRRMAAHPAD